MIQQVQCLGRLLLGAAVTKSQVIRAQLLLELRPWQDFSRLLRLNVRTVVWVWDFPNPGWPESPLKKQRKGIFNRLKLDRLEFSWGHFFLCGMGKVGDEG